jgi:hypothetical protein
MKNIRPDLHSSASCAVNDYFWPTPQGLAKDDRNPVLDALCLATLSLVTDSTKAVQSVSIH